MGKIQAHCSSSANLAAAAADASASIKRWDQVPPPPPPPGLLRRQTLLLGYICFVHIVVGVADQCQEATLLMCCDIWLAVMDVDQKLMLLTLIAMSNTHLTRHAASHFDINRECHVYYHSMLLLLEAASRCLYVLVLHH